MFLLQPVCFRENEKAAQQQQQAESVEQKLESKVTETTEKGGSLQQRLAWCLRLSRRVVDSQSDP